MINIYRYWVNNPISMTPKQTSKRSSMREYHHAIKKTILLIKKTSYNSGRMHAESSWMKSSLISDRD